MERGGAPSHIGLWHRYFWLMSVSAFLLSSTSTMFIPTMPQWLLSDLCFSESETAVSMIVFGLGLFASGSFTSFLVEHYRRNMVFAVAVVCEGATLLTLSLLPLPSFAIVTLIRFLQGLFFGLAQMVLVSTLVIDTCVSQQRTTANHFVTWFSRMALALGPVFSLLVFRLWGPRWVMMLSVWVCGLVLLLVLLVRFPFRIPQDHLRLVSLDRFFLPQGLLLFVNLLLVTVAVGMTLSLPLTIHGYCLMALGFAMAVVAQHFVFRDAELKSEMVSGMILMACSLLVMLKSLSSPLAMPMLGLGLGIVASRFLLFFVKLSRHCQRGTSQSTYMLGWESGLALGVGIGVGCYSRHPEALLFSSLALLSLALLVYVAFIHQWFVRHKNR